MKFDRDCISFSIALVFGVFLSYFTGLLIHDSVEKTSIAEYTVTTQIAAINITESLEKALLQTVAGNVFSYDYPITREFYNVVMKTQLKTKGDVSAAFIIKTDPNDIESVENDLSLMYNSTIDINYLDGFVNDDPWILYYREPELLSLVGLDVNAEAGRRAGIEKMLRTNSTAASKLIELAVVGKGILFFEPIFFKEEIVASIVYIFFVKNFFDSILSNNLDYKYQIRINDEVIIGEDEINEGDYDLYIKSIEDFDIQVYIYKFEQTLYDRYFIIASIGCFFMYMMVVFFIVKYIQKTRKENAFKNNFISSMSHEIRTPMNGIMGMTELIMDQECLSETSRQYMGVVISCGNTLLNIINDILDMSKIEAGMMSINKIDCNLIPHVLESVQNAWISHANKTYTHRLEKNVQTILTVDNNFPTSIRCDPVRIKQIISNLVTNALKFTDEGIVTIRMCIRNENVRISVKDTGIGMSPKDAEKSFKPFEQVHKSREVGGTGLGLPITKTLIDLMGGTIVCKSILGVGTTITVDVKLENILKNEVVLTDNLQWIFEKSGSNKVKTYSVKSNKSIESILEEVSCINVEQSCPLVLIVDDNKVNRMVLSKMMDTVSIEYDTCDNGIQAIESSESKKYSVIFMDMVMPGMTGDIATRIIKENKNNLNNKTPVIFLTANITIEGKNECIESGGVEVITKPIKRISILKSMISHIEPSEKKWIYSHYNTRNSV